MGSGQGCGRRLSAVVTIGSLESQGLEIKEDQEDEASIQLGGAIAQVCLKGPPDLTVDEGAQRVADVVWERYAD